MNVTSDDHVLLKTDAGTLALRLTPWDRAALGMVTVEILRLEPHSSTNAIALIEIAQRWARERGGHYLFGRIDAKQEALKGALLESGYALVEYSLTLSRASLTGLPIVPSRMRPLLRHSRDDDLPELQRIAREDFTHGRFFEDPSIDPTLAAARNANWVSDLVRQGLAYTAELNGRIVGFHAERVDTTRAHADLILTGVTSRYAVLALPLWVTALESLAARDVHTCSTLVSSANVGVINLYAKLGFHFNTALLGFRKYL